ncbi:heparinase II/III domain-containing protein [Mesorhizobium australicum]|uniref:heparinase II/III domain-containing protein n=1 Tax=Mesorhizobium australicum TaxID=536018 RepID=UPI00333B5D72
MMFLGRGGLNRLRQRVQKDEWARQAAYHVLAEANEMLDLPTVHHSLDQRNVLLSVARLLARRVQTLGVAWFVTGDARYRERLAGELVAAATFPDWNRTHFIDTAEIMAAVALGRDWIESFLSTEHLTTIDLALTEFGLIPARESFLLPSPWVNASNNWTIVCSAGSIIAALALRRSRSDLSDYVIDLAAATLARGLNAYGPDGGYKEGPTYWAYATDYAALAIAALEDAGTASFHSPGTLASTWRFGKAMTAPSGTLFDYGDSVATPDRCHALGWLANRSGEPEAAAWQREAPGDPRPFDLVWPAEPSAQPAKRRWGAESFVDAGVSVIRHDDLYVALKGGANDVNHAHLDLGSFIIEIHGRRFVSDLGRETYNLPGYFSPKTRFGYFRTSTAAHNTLVFEDRNQAVTARAIFLGSCPGVEGFSAAYRIEDPNAPCQFTRAVALVPACGIAITDRILCSKNASDAADWRINTLAEVELDGQGAVLTLDGKSIFLRIAGVKGADLTAAPVTTQPQESDNSGFIRLSHRFTVGGKPTLLTAIFALNMFCQNELERVGRRLHNWLAFLNP